MVEQAHQPDAVFVRRALRIGADAPDAAPRLAVTHRENDVGVAAVYDEKHGRAIPTVAGSSPRAVQ